MPRIFAVLTAVVVLALGAIWASAYVVRETEQVLIVQFGEPIGAPITEPGLHWKLPFVQKALRFDKRWLEWDGDEAEMPTREKTFIVVDAYARWRIIDPLKFYTSVGTEVVAQTRLDGIINSAVRNVVASHDLIEVVRLSNRPFDKVATEEGALSLEEKEDIPRTQIGRDTLSQLVLEKAAEAMPDYGIELVDVQFQRVIYTDSVKKKVFDRMIAERHRIAERYRSQGEGKRAEILGKKEFELKRIQSEAYRRAEELKGQAEAEATDIYAAAHNKDPKFYRLLKSLESYKASIDDKSWIMLSTDSEYFRVLTDPGGR